MGYGDSKLGILSSLHSFAAGRRARLAVRVDDVANLARFQIFTKELFRQTGVDSGHWPDINAEPPRALSPHRH